jgi:peptidoglycan/LPS O-acetylase OafA/YrhL
MSTVTAPQTFVRGTSAARFYRPELDALRFFAFFGVFVFHTMPRLFSYYDAVGLPRWISHILVPVFGSGAFGVDLFFALSSYLITTLLLRERAATGSLDLRNFYLRRILRIWPLYLSFVVLAAVVAAFSSAQNLPLRYTFGYALLAGNWLYVFYGLPASFAVPLWTVSIEEQLYLVWPLAVRRTSGRRMIMIAFALLAISNLCRILIAAFHGSTPMMEYSTLTRLDPIALGILMAVAGDSMPSLSRWKRIALLSAGLLTWIASYAYCWSDPDHPALCRLTIGHPLIALASAVILTAVMGSQHPFLRNRILLYLGKISYGLYVVHEFGHFCAERLISASTPLRMLAQAATSLVFTLLLAAASYRWLEKPFLRWKERFAYVPSRPV